MNKLLLIIDPQIDFINGSLPVAGSEQAMNDLALYVHDSDGCYVHKVVTADHHPFDHCSFANFGGQWPQHCIHDTVGASIWQALIAPLYLTQGDVTVLYKGINPKTEEYSIFKNRESRETLLKIIESEKIDRIDICGLAGDICVLDTLKDGIEILGKEKFHVLTRFAPSLDGGAALADTISGLDLSSDK